MRKIFFFLLPLIFSLQSPPKVFAVVQKWPVKLHSNSSVSLEGGESNNILFDSDVTTIYNKLTVYADADFDFSTEFELAANALNELEVEVAEGGAKFGMSKAIATAGPGGVGASGGSHTCAILTDDSVKCWGGNYNGQLGLGDTNSRGDESNEMGDNLPAVNLGTGRTAKAIATGGYHTCALLDNDSVKCWGE